MRRFTGALLAALVLAACSRVSDTSGAGQRHSWTHANELRIGIQRSPNTLNPILAANTTEALVDRLIFDVLVSVDGTGQKHVPILAADVPTTENGGISKDGLTVTYHLRSGVKWHDGQPFTSKDVAFTWRAIMSKDNNVNTRVGYEDIASVDTPDDTTVVFHLKHIFAPFVDTVFGESDQPYHILPEHLLGKLPNINQIPFNSEPIGTGPFKVTRWIKGDHIELAANDDYFRGKPGLRTIIVREIPDENTEINALRSHDIDWMFEPSPQTYNTLKSLQDISIVLRDQPQTLKVQMNTAREALKDVRVRQAIAYSVDKQGLVDKLTGGSARVATEDQPLFSWSYEPNVKKYGLDVAKAKALLAQAGYTPGPGGTLQKNGQPLSLQISYNVENATRRLVAVQLQAALKQIGIDSQIKTYPANLFFATYGQGGILTNGKYDVNVSGWVAGVDPDDHSLFRCDQFPPAGTNYTRYCSPAMDAAQNAALGTYDQKTRKAAYAKVQQILANDVPEVFVWYGRFPQAINPDFKGFDPNPISEAWNAHLWSI